MDDFRIENDITHAETLPSEFYRSEEIFNLLKEKVFAASWQFASDTEAIPEIETAKPFVLLPGYLNEPLVLSRDAKHQLYCLSNVCTHRGNILVQHPGKYKRFTCNYHGRTFSCEGKFMAMPEFKEAENFPRPSDDLHKISIKEWNQFAFISLNPQFEFENVAEKMNERIGFLPIKQFRFASELSREYLVNANWALYCDNYLEGFHIPFVHPDLNKALDYAHYTTEIFEYCNLQIGAADSATECFDLPMGHIDFGKRIAAYYYWIFPNMMFNFYPWGLSINIVKPLSVNQCKVSFFTYVFNEDAVQKGVGNMLDKVEREDEFVVESVQRGLQSRFYHTGRFSPSREKGVHHFHQLLSRFLEKK